MRSSCRRQPAEEIRSPGTELISRGVCSKWFSQEAQCTSCKKSFSCLCFVETLLISAAPIELHSQQWQNLPDEAHNFRDTVDHVLDFLDVVQRFSQITCRLTEILLVLLYVFYNVAQTRI